MFWDCCLKVTKTKKIALWLAWPLDEGAEHLGERNLDFKLIPYPLQEGICMSQSLSLHQHPETKKGFEEQIAAYYSQSKQEIIAYIFKATQKF